MRLITSNGTAAFEKTWKVRCLAIQPDHLNCLSSRAHHFAASVFASLIFGGKSLLMSYQAVGGLGPPRDCKVHLTVEVQPDSAPAQLEITVSTTVLLGKLKYKGSVMRKEKPVAAIVPLLSHRRSPSGRCVERLTVLTAWDVGVCVCVRTRKRE